MISQLVNLSTRVCAWLRSTRLHKLTLECFTIEIWYLRNFLIEVLASKRQASKWLPSGFQVAFIVIRYDSYYDIFTFSNTWVNLIKIKMEVSAAFSSRTDRVWRSLNCTEYQSMTGELSMINAIKRAVSPMRSCRTDTNDAEFIGCGKFVANRVHFKQAQWPIEGALCTFLLQLRWVWTNMRWSLTWLMRFPGWVPYWQCSQAVDEVFFIDIET